MQIRVRQRFAELQKQDETDGEVPWHVVNAAQSIEDVQKEINTIVESTISKIEEGSPLKSLWKEAKKTES